MGSKKKDPILNSDQNKQGTGTSISFSDRIPRMQNSGPKKNPLVYNCSDASMITEESTNPEGYRDRYMDWDTTTKDGCPLLRQYGGGGGGMPVDTPERAPNDNSVQAESDEQNEEDEHGEDDDIFSTPHFPDSLNENVNELEANTEDTSRETLQLLAHVEEEFTSRTKFARHPFHGTLGLIGNCHQFNLCIELKKQNGSKQIDLWKKDRCVQGMQIYCPRERSHLDRRSKEKYHRDMQHYSRMAITLLHPLNTNHMEENKYKKVQEKFYSMTKVGVNLLDSYLEKHSNKDEHGGGEVRIEYCLAFTDGLDEIDDTTDLLPILNKEKTSPLRALSCAELDDVFKDIKETNNEILPALELFSSYEREYIASLPPAVKTAIVYLSERFQQKVNSTDPGFQGVHKNLVDKGIAKNYKRVQMPSNCKELLDIEQQNQFKLKYALKTSLLPWCYKFDHSYNTISSNGSTRPRQSPNYMSQDKLDKLPKMNDAKVLKIAWQRLAAFKAHHFLGMEPNSNVEVGLFDLLDYSKWIELSDEEKWMSLLTLAGMFLLVYMYEINVLVLKRYKNAATRDPGTFKERYEYLLSHHRGSSPTPKFTIMRDILDFRTRYPNDPIVDVDSSTRDTVKTIG